MQALFESSEENGHTKGFGFIKGNVIKMEDTNVRIPHIGWNDLQFVKDMPLKINFQKHLLSIMCILIMQVIMTRKIWSHIQNMEI